MFCAEGRSYSFCPGLVLIRKGESRGVALLRRGLGVLKEALSLNMFGHAEYFSIGGFQRGLCPLGGVWGTPRKTRLGGRVGEER